LIMLVRQCWLAVDRQYQLTLDGRLGQLVLTANEKLSTRLRRILSLESRDSQLKEAPDSPNFVLASTINKLLDQRNAAASVMEDQGQALIQSLHEMDGLLSAMSSTQGEADRIVASSHINTGHFSALVSEFSDQLARLRQPMATGLDQVSRLSGLTQGALWKLDAVRETTQDASKRIKRLGESAQAVSSSSDSVRGIASQAKVLALNLAVEAAQRGEDGRVFADVAKELESLARDLDGAVGDIDFQSNAIQDDSRQTVEVMEQGVANVVECARLSGDATTAAKGLLAHVQDIDQSQLEISSGLSAAAQGVLSEQGSLAQALAGIRSQAERLEAMRERAATPRSAVQAFRAWLGQLGRDI
jgi:ABC-type transporter Mla subunit MlaD